MTVTNVSLPYYKIGSGIGTEFGAMLPPGSNVVAYVRSTGVQSLDPPFLQKKGALVTTLDAALARCRSGYDDVVMVLPNHAESISSADQMSSLKAGTRIYCIGDGTNRPTWTWTAATASWLFDVANVRLYNARLVMASAANGGVTVAAPITVSAAGAHIEGCHIDFGADADDIVGQAINTTAAADDMIFAYNRCFGATAAECETFFNMIGCDRLQMVGNYISGATSAVAVGLVRAEGTASLNIRIEGNYIANNLADSEEALTLMAGCTGLLEDNRLAVLDDATVALDNDGNCTYGPNNTLANTVGERGIVLGAESAAT